MLDPHAVVGLVVRRIGVRHGELGAVSCLWDGAMNLGLVGQVVIDVVALWGARLDSVALLEHPHAFLLNHISRLPWRDPAGVAAEHAAAKNG